MRTGRTRRRATGSQRRWCRCSRWRRFRRYRWMAPTRGTFLRTRRPRVASALVGSPRLDLMCGIVGYVGRTDDGTALDVVMEGLARLEYRGYDSAGVALLDGDHVETRKKSGKLANLAAELEAHPLPSSTTGIGHTRWATHGGPTDENAHPHRGGQDGKLGLIHNGIIENFHSLKKGLQADGVEFTSETDTEVVAHLVAAAYEREH